MRKIFAVLICVVALAFNASSVSADTYVHGYVKKNGTYVQPHMRSDPDGSTLNNLSTQGNVNPYTGKFGTRDPYPTTPNSSSYGGTRSYAPHNFLGDDRD